MSTVGMRQWLEKLGYADEPRVLHRRGDEIPESHPYAVEIKTLLRPEGAIRAQAVFDVAGVPTVVFVEDNGTPIQANALDEIRKRIWNQNLATVVIEVIGDRAKALPVRRLQNVEEWLSLSEARSDGPFSALEISSANLPLRKPEWFDVKARVDRRLLENISYLIAKLSSGGFDKAREATNRRQAELLMGQILFISYLEHRDIVGPTYRNTREVGHLHRLIAAADQEGLRRLIDSLRVDFNGDFLGDDRHDPWAALSAPGFEMLDSFLRRTEMTTGQESFWNYDFSFIPVELLSGLYESFLSTEEQAKDGAYYTPRHLAMLAVDQVFATSDDPLGETIFDGACGSGILLTTAYRRLIGLSEARFQKQLTFRERRELLVSHIFGADINFMACRVTAFSLYLSLLEGLDPADIMEAQERENVKLPPLDGTNLQHGDAGDFFRPSHGFTGRRFSIIISNPPWSEPEGEEVTSADVWALEGTAPFVRRQIAGAYTLRSLDFLETFGRVCLILPIGQFLGPSSASFVRHTLEVFRPTRLINFGDLQNLLFPTTENTCHLFMAICREQPTVPIPAAEVFEYLVPKADMSLAYGRLTMQSADRHVLQTTSVAEDPQLLVTLMWGDANDLALWTRLSTRSTFRDFWRGPVTSRRWINRKGVHLEDKSRPPMSAAPLADLPFIPTTALSAGVPVLHPAFLEAWPEEHSTVASVNAALLRVFDGPRVMFPDGFSRGEQSIRAVYFDAPATFTHSIGVIAGDAADAALLQFVAVYLRSSLARYFLMMRAWKMLCERNGVHLADVETFPFFDTIAAPNTQRAEIALAGISARVSALSQLSPIEQASSYAALRDSLDDDVFDYFDLSDDERALVRETVKIFMPSIRPRSFKNLHTPAQHTANRGDLDVYAEYLGRSLAGWRERTGGKGTFHVNVTTSEYDRAAPTGLVRISYSTGLGKATTSSAIDNEAVLATLSELRRLGLNVIPSGDSLQLVPDAHIWANGELFLVRSLARRSWTIRQALRDAEHIVRMVQNKQTSGKDRGLM